MLRLEEVEKPVPRDDEVLLAVHAASVNATDWEIVTGKSFLVRLITGLRKPKRYTLGADIAGRIEAVGADVKQFQPGDEVVGEVFGRWGGFAEYVCAREKALAAKPASMTYEQATTLPTAALLALHGLGGKERMPTGCKVLINGAGGGVGTFAIQMARSSGAEVTAVDSVDKLDLMRSIGAHHVIDYTEEDFTRNGKRYDLILDVVGYRSIFDYLRALAPKGRFVLLGGSDSAILRVGFLGPWIARVQGKRMGILISRTNLRADLAYLEGLFKTGDVVPVIDRCYPLSEVPEAIRYVGQGQARGKVVITP